MTRLVPVVMLAVLGCSTWVTRSLPDAGMSWADSVHRHRVTLTGGTRHVMEQVVLSGDTLRGLRLPERDTVALARGEIARLQARRFDAAKTVSLVAGLGILVVVANVVVADAFDDSCCLALN